jgi:hypothetical protein
MELIFWNRSEEIGDFTSFRILEIIIVLLECDETSVKKCSLRVREDYFCDLFIFHIILEEFSYELLIYFYVICTTENCGKFW